MISLHRLEGFYWVVREGGYAKAARAFPYPITAPAVHQQVSKLEGELGVELLERVSKDTMRPTAAGQYLHGFVAPFFERLPAIVRDVAAGSHGGEIRIHAASMLLRDIVPAWVRRLQRRAPKAQVVLHESTVPGPDLVRSGEADLVVSYLPDVPEDLESRCVGWLYGVVVVPRGHRLAKHAEVSLRELTDETFVGYNAGLLAHEVQMRGLAAQGVRPARTITASTAHTILAFVEAGLGVTALATVDPGGPRGRNLVSLRVVDPPFVVPVTMVWRRAGPRNPALAAALATAPRPGPPRP